MSIHITLTSVPVHPGDNSYVEGCVADLHYPTFSGIHLGELADLGAPNVLLDVDGTLIAHGSGEFSADELTRSKLRELTADQRFRTVSLATENGGHPSDLRNVLGLTALHAVFQPFEAGNLGTQWKTSRAFWRKILFELDCFDNPEQMVIIGDSPARDIMPAQENGIKTVLVDRLTESWVFTANR